MINLQQTKNYTMKKLMLTFVLIATCSFGLMAQSNGGSDAQLINQAIQLLKGADCLDIPPGQADGTVNTIATCFAGGFVKEVVIFTACHGNNCETFLPAVIGRVFFNCGGSKGDVTVICESN